MARKAGRSGRRLWGGEELLQKMAEESRDKTRPACTYAEIEKVPVSVSVVGASGHMPVGARHGIV